MCILLYLDINSVYFSSFLGSNSSMHSVANNVPISDDSDQASETEEGSEVDSDESDEMSNYSKLLFISALFIFLKCVHHFSKQALDSILKTIVVSQIAILDIFIIAYM